MGTPDDLWQIWFGSNNLFYGIVISPVFGNGTWSNDRSEMRRAPYVYWTIGHVMATGLVSPDEESVMPFASVEGFLAFYRAGSRPLEQQRRAGRHTIA